MFRMSSRRTIPRRRPSASTTGKRLRDDCAMVSHISLSDISGLTMRKSVSTTESIFRRVRTALSLW